MPNTSTDVQFRRFYDATQGTPAHCRRYHHVMRLCSGALCVRRNGNVVVWNIPWPFTRDPSDELNLSTRRHPLGTHGGIEFFCTIQKCQKIRKIFSEAPYF